MGENPNKIELSFRLKILIGLFLITCVAAAVYLLIKFDMYDQLTRLINENTPARLFIILMIFLPLVGVVLSLFIFVLGIKFGIVYGILLLEIILPIHFLLAYVLAVSLRKPIENFLVNKRNYRIPTIPEDKMLLYSALLVAFPMFPYSVKIYILPLAGVPFRYCFWLNWLIQGILCIPFVVLGKSAADKNVTLIVISLLIIVALVLFLRWLQKRYSGLGKEKPV